MNSDSNYSSVRNLGNTVSLTSATKISSAFIRDGEKMEVEGAAKVKSYHDEAFR